MLTPRYRAGTHGTKISNIRFLTFGCHRGRGGAGKLHGRRISPRLAGPRACWSGPCIWPHWHAGEAATPAVGTTLTAGCERSFDAPPVVLSLGERKKMIQYMTYGVYSQVRNTFPKAAEVAPNDLLRFPTTCFSHHLFSKS
jgi:hypothetical protein